MREKRGRENRNVKTEESEPRKLYTEGSTQEGHFGKKKSPLRSAACPVRKYKILLSKVFFFSFFINFKQNYRTRFRFLLPYF